MKRNFLTYIILIFAIGLFVACEKTNEFVDENGDFEKMQGEWCLIRITSNNPDYTQYFDCDNTSDKLIISTTKDWQKLHDGEIVGKGKILRLFSKTDDKVDNGVMHSCVEFYDEISEQTRLKYYTITENDSVTMCTFNSPYLGGESRYIWKKTNN